MERVTGISPSGTDEESERNRHTLFSSSTILFSVNDQAPARGSTIDQSPPIMSNGELLFIYFQLLVSGLVNDKIMFVSRPKCSSMGGGGGDSPV